MKIVTWNINSVRLRIGLALRLLEEQKPDVLCLQETKTPDEFFPRDAFIEKGYVHQHIAGMKGYNGVAILSRLPLTDTQIHRRCGKDDCRHISAVVGGTEVHNIYVPAGGYEPDMEEEKFRHKLAFVDELTAWFGKERAKKDKMIAVGDLNIAPMENDVWDHAKMLNVVSHTPIETEKFARFYNSVGWVDAVRKFVPEDKKLYSWWSYRSPDWDAADKGRRLDHVWVTHPLESALKSQSILRDVRGWVQPSDHAPIVVSLS